MVSFSGYRGVSNLSPPLPLPRQEWYTPPRWLKSNHVSSLVCKFGVRFSRLTHIFHSFAANVEKIHQAGSEG